MLENEKRSKQLANLASEKEIRRENRKAITSESQVTPYSKLVELLGKNQQINLFVAQLMPLLFAQIGALLPVKQQFPMDVLHQVSVHRPRICGPVAVLSKHEATLPILMRSWKALVGKTHRSGGGHIST